MLIFGCDLPITQAANDLKTQLEQWRLLAGNSHKDFPHDPEGGEYLKNVDNPLFDEPDDEQFIYMRENEKTDVLGKKDTTEQVIKHQLEILTRASLWSGHSADICSPQYAAGCYILDANVVTPPFHNCVVSTVDRQKQLLKLRQSAS